MTEKTKIQHLQYGISLGAFEAGGVTGASRHDLAAFIVLNEVSTSKCELLKDLASRVSVHLSHTASPGQASRCSVVEDSGEGSPTAAGLTPGFLGGVACGPRISLEEWHMDGWLRISWDGWHSGYCSRCSSKATVKMLAWASSEARWGWRLCSQWFSHITNKFMMVVGVASISLHRTV